MEFVDSYIIIGIAAFLIGLILLSRTSYKRFFNVFFMIETRHGLRFVDNIARLSPYFWKFVGDIAIVVSFGGVGGYYVVKYRNTWSVALVLGAAALIFTYLSFGVVPAVIGVCMLAAGVYVLRRSERKLMHLAAAAVIMGVIAFEIFPMLSDMGFLKPYVSVLVGVFGIPSLLISLLFSQALKIILLQSSIPGVSPLLPTVSSEGPGFFFPGTGIFIPFWQALIAMICLLVPHEFAHGVLTRSHKIRLKSAGILTAGPLPIGGFVEPDEKGMKLYRSRGRMRIYAIGSFTNLIVALIALLLLVSVMGPALGMMTEPTGMIITNVANGTPAYDVLEKGYVIKEINGMPTLDIGSFNLAVSQIKPGQQVNFVTSNGTFNLTVTSRTDNASRGYIGIDLQETSKLKDEFGEKYRLQAEAVFFFAPTLFWIFFLSFNVALVNLLPIVPFDGGKMFEELVAEFRIRRSTKELLVNAVIILIVGLMLVNASPLLLNLLR